jgi:hypothetical protein
VTYKSKWLASLAGIRHYCFYIIAIEGIAFLILLAVVLR